MRSFWKQSLVILILLFPLSEIAARIIGWKPLYNHDYHIASEPTFWLRADSTMGIRLSPGNYKVTLNHKLTFTATHTEEGMRKTGLQSASGPEVDVFGCSFTYGYGVSDECTFSWLLQERFRDYSFRNHAVPGHGTVQALMKLKAVLAGGAHPHTAMLVYSQAHPERNVMAMKYRKALKIGFTRSDENAKGAMRTGRFPFVENGKINYCAWEELYYNWPGRETFAIVNALQCSLEQDIPEADQLKTTGELLIRFADLCASNGIRCVVVNLDDPHFTRRYPELNRREDITVIPVGFDFSDPLLTNAPHDSHPNAKGHRRIAEKIIPEFEKHLNESQ